MSNRRNETITLSQLIEIPPGDRNNASWVNGEFEAIVSNTKRSSGKGPSSALLSDPHNPNISIQGSFWIDPTSYEGCLCLFSPPGMARTEYKGAQQVTIGDKTKINVLSRGATPAPAARTSQPLASGDTRQPAPASHGAHAINGATVGMAINQAVGIIKDTVPKDGTGCVDPAYFQSPDFSRDLHTIASDIIRVSAMLEAGKLAPSAKHRADPGAAEREAAEKARIAEEARKVEEERKRAEEAKKNKPQPGPGDSAFPTTADDEDVPF